MRSYVGLGSSPFVRSALIRCTAETPTPHSLATLRIPALRERQADLLLGLPIDPRPAEMLARGASSGDSRPDTLDDDRPFELGEDAEHLKERATGRSSRIDALLV